MVTSPPVHTINILMASSIKISCLTLSTVGVENGNVPSSLAVSAVQARCYCFPVLKWSEPDIALVPLMEEEVRLLPGGCAVLTFNSNLKRRKQGLMKRDCGLRRETPPVEISSRHVFITKGPRMGWDGMDPHEQIAFENTKR